QNEGATLLR
ncbi:hypothetical protein CSHISOI_02840, partial [Colletotrichum shisoi]